jgi:glycosyltransferase involved in cell wall biosynthesis
VNGPRTRPVRVLCITPEQQGGIASYARLLWPAIVEAARADGRFEPLPLLQTAPGDWAGATAAARILQPDLVHVQHEYGLFGGTNPFLDTLPRWLPPLRHALPAGTRIIATAHRVLPDDHRLETRGRGWQGPLNRMANATMLPWLRPYWREGTWSRFDGVIVHSAMQAASLQGLGYPPIATIPHIVPDVSSSSGDRPDTAVRTVTVFGYICPEKGQDVMLEALPHVRTPVRLRLAGGVGHPMNHRYCARCQRTISELGLHDRVEVTGFVPESDVTRVFQTSDLVVAPFRVTSGSGSLAQAFARGAAVLASDLPLNREINERVPDTLAFFASEDPIDCARQIDALLTDADRRRRMGQQARVYASLHAPAAIARQHLDCYGWFLDHSGPPDRARSGRPVLRARCWLARRS